MSAVWSLLVRHAGHSILLTGDFEGEGLERVLATSSRQVDVMMAPHHGSKVANTPALAAWAKPRLVIACQGPPPWPTAVADVYAARGAQVSRHLAARRGHGSQSSDGTDCRDVSERSADCGADGRRVRLLSRGLLREPRPWGSKGVPAVLTNPNLCQAFRYRCE